MYWIIVIGSIVSVIMGRDPSSILLFGIMTQLYVSRSEQRDQTGAQVAALWEVYGCGLRSEHGRKEQADG